MRKFYRCRWDKKVAGVCGGLGQYFRCDPTLIRLILVFLCIVTAFAPFLIAYAIIWLIVPLGPTTYVEIPCKKLYRSKVNRKIAGVCGGLSEYFKIDPTILRVIFLILTFTTFIAPTLISYIIGSAIIPENPDQ